MSQLHEPGVYVKGDLTLVCHTVADVVNARFRGFKLQAVEAEPEAVEPEVEVDDEDGLPQLVEDDEPLDEQAPQGPDLYSF